MIQSILSYFIVNFIYKIESYNSCIDKLKYVIEYDSQQFIEDATWWDQSGFAERILNNSIQIHTNTESYNFHNYHQLIIWPDGKAHIKDINGLLIQARSPVIRARHPDEQCTSALEVEEYKRDGFYSCSDELKLKMFNIAQIISSTKVFTDVNLCIDFIMEIEYAKFFLIVSESIAKTVIPPIHDTVQLDSIYIFSTDDVKHEQCTSAWKKVEGVFFDISSICDQLQRNIKHGDQDGIPTNLEKNIGCLIAFTNFLSTTTNSPEALLYAESAEENSELIGIIFEVTVDPSISSIPFVPLSDVNDIPFCENEILFSMHSVFRIDAIEQVTDYLWSIDMTLTSDTDEQLQCLAQSLRNEIEGPNPLHRLGKLLIKMGEFDKAEEIFQTLLHTTSNVDREQLVPFSFPKVSIFCEDEEELAVRWALDTANNCRRLGGEYAKQGDKDLARDYFQRGKELYKRLAQIIGQTKPETSK
ncbi:hypothetical protein I4U23_011478 [Adineta vaga]|nr:hypothetical protein I4U23_011478 [Adineta vaga]